MPSAIENAIANGAVINGAYHYNQQFSKEPRPLHVVIIGAGVSGIGAVKLFKERFADKAVTLTIYEKNEDVGGTWLENRYPGCSCDVPAHGYTYSWEGNPNWSQAYVGAQELFDYFQGRAKAFGVYDFVKLNHKVVSAIWDDETSKWRIEVEDTTHRRVIVDEADVLINAGGFLNKWKWPDLPGLHNFKGHLVHSANWDDSYDFNGKTIACIGTGSSAIQIVPSLQPVVHKLISLIRSPSWITPELAAETAPEGRDTIFTDQQRAEWAADPKKFLKFRKLIESSMNHLYDIHYKGSEIQQKMATQFAVQMRDRLKNKPSIADKLIPDFGVGCRRVTPGTGYLEALAADNVEVVFDEIASVTEAGVQMKNGKLYQIDALIAATGFDTSFRPPFPLIGRNGKNLQDVWKAEPESYLSIALPDFPNYFLVAGPNFTLANGVFIPCVETVFKYFFEAIEKMQTEGIKSFEPKAEAVQDFQEHKDDVMKDMVWTSSCRSWYKNGKVDGRVWGPWPGSSVHFMEIMARPRWEDYNFQYLKNNRFNYFGNGKTLREKNGGDLSYYLSERGYHYEDESSTKDSLSAV